MDAVAIEDVTKTYSSVTAVDNLSLRVPEGSVYGFIGPNGSGKSTTLRMIMRILVPDKGRIVVLGEERHGAAHDRIGYLPEERGLYKKMKVRDLLVFHAQLKGMADPGPVVDRWLSRLGLADWGGKLVEALSKGMAQKVQFIATVAHSPRLVILDEPFSGLDPVNADVVRDEILKLRRDGATVIFSTHDMAVAERMCDFIFMIFKGKKVLDGTLAGIQETYGEDTVRVRLGGTRVGEGLPGVVRAVDHGNEQELQLERGGDTQALLAELARRGRVERFEIARPSLHDIFVRIAGPEAGEGRIPETGVLKAETRNAIRLEEKP
ncbi:MAG: ATP-binding cassette domain-containing protein [Gemmataceae bacterium]|nr:ATP-binding cassette domain-containing protein [Gemmataceae bacterium]